MKVLGVPHYLLSGRKINRWLVTIILAMIGLAVVIAFFRWAFGAPFPEIPAQGIIIAALPYIQSMWDNVVRSREEVDLAHIGRGSPNPHGGPGAP